MTNLIVTAENLCLRDKPSLQGGVVDILNKSEKVEYLSSSGDSYWRKINHSGIIGWASQKYLRTENKAPEEIVSESKYPWFDIAIQELGVKEVTGSGDNLRVVEYLRSTTLKAPESSNDETPWCSAFVNWCVEKAGCAGTDSAWARSWLNWGRKTETPEVGCIVVFERGVSCGHVAFFVSKTDSTIKVLGGNQHDSVCISCYSIDRILGYRVPK